MTNWINPKTIIGNTAIGQYYYDRPQIIANIWEEIGKGNHVLLAAPRRVGKSSVMKYMAENCSDCYNCIFENIQGIDTEEAFYKTIYRLVKSCLSNKQKTINWFTECLRKIKIEEVTAGGLKLGERTINYLEAIEMILPQLNSLDYKLILFIDELPEVLHNLYKEGKSGEALSILKNLRRWRQEDQFDNFRLVLAGSIGIHYVVKAITGRTIDTNDFNKIDFEVLVKKEAEDYIGWATNNGATIQYNEKQRQYLLLKVRHYLPYFINLMLNEINKGAKKKESIIITEADIDEAFDKIVKDNDHFKEWKNRLFDYMSRHEAHFLNHILTYIAHNDLITIQKIHDLAVKYDKRHNYMELIDDLQRDGYIMEEGEVYVFISPFLKAFWKRNNPII